MPARMTPVAAAIASAKGALRLARRRRQAAASTAAARQQVEQAPNAGAAHDRPRNVRSGSRTLPTGDRRGLRTRSARTGISAAAVAHWRQVERRRRERLGMAAASAAGSADNHDHREQRQHLDQRRSRPQARRPRALRTTLTDRQQRRRRRSPAATTIRPRRSGRSDERRCSTAATGRSPARCRPSSRSRTSR